MESGKDKIEFLAKDKSEKNELISIYMPVKPLEAKANELRLRAHIESLDPSECQESLDNLREKLESDFDPMEFKRLNNRVTGLCIFSKPVETLILPVAFNVPNFSACAKTFFLSPILVNMNQLDYYYFLALSQNHPRLFEANLLEIEEIDLSEKLNGDLLKKMGIDENKNSLNIHSTSRKTKGGTAVQAAAFHGHSDHVNSTKTEVLTKFFREVDKNIGEILSQKGKVAILGGTDDKLSLMRKVAKNLKFSGISVSGNFEHDNVDEIHEKLIPTIKRLMETEKTTNLDSSGMVHNPRTIVDTASNGGVESLYIDHSHLVNLFENHPEDGFILEAAARNTTMNGGEVLGMNGQALNPVSAVLRAGQRKTQDAGI